MEIAAVIVTYYPEPERLQQALEAILKQVNFIFIIDNTPETIKNNYRFLFSDKIHFLELNKNTGIAVAQNAGIQLAKKNQVDYILFLDQDSVPDKKMVSELITAWQFLETKKYKIAAVGPSVNKNKITYQPRIDVGEKIEPHIKKVKQLISSGSLIKTNIFQEVGLFETDLFIDAVDFEWCWRTAKKDYHCFQIENTFIEHEFGEGENLFLGWPVPVPSPQRCYYLYRNYLWLLRRSYVPLYWKISYFFKFLARIFYYSIFVKPQKEYRRHIRKGIYDGLKKYYGETAR